MSKSSAALVALPLAATLLLAACGDDKPKPQASPGSGTPKPATSSPPMSSPPATKSTTVAVPSIPAAARAHTSAGAEAFVGYYLKTANAAWSAPHSGVIRSLSASTCKSCANWEKTASAMASDHTRYSADALTVNYVSGQSGTVGASYGVYASVRQKPVTVVDEAGAVKERVPLTEGDFEFELGWRGGGWVTQGIRAEVRATSPEATK